MKLSPTVFVLALAAEVVVVGGWFGKPGVFPFALFLFLVLVFSPLRFGVLSAAAWGAAFDKLWPTEGDLYLSAFTGSSSCLSSWHARIA